MQIGQIIFTGSVNSRLCVMGMETTYLGGGGSVGNVIMMKYLLLSIFRGDLRIPGDPEKIPGINADLWGSHSYAVASQFHTSTYVQLGSHSQRNVIVYACFITPILTPPAPAIVHSCLPSHNVKS